MQEKIQKTLKYLKARNLDGRFAEDVEEARSLMLDLIGQDATVGFGGSSTIKQIGIIEGLKKRGTPVIDPLDFMADPSGVESPLVAIFKKLIDATVCDVFLSSTNALTQDGRLLNIDGSGNRVAGMAWGHPKVIVVAGKNKIVKDLDEAFDRVKNVIVHEHLKRHIQASDSPPCVKKGKCTDCIGEKRVCNLTTIMEGKPVFSEVHVIIVNQDLGLGWNQTWPQDRIDKIAAYHDQYAITQSGGLRELDIKLVWEAVKGKLGS